AELEWRVARAFHARERALLDTRPLATWTMRQWQRATLRFQPSVALVCSPWPLRELWELRETPLEKIDLDLRNRSDRALVCRSGFTVRCESIDLPEATALAALLAGHTLGEATRMLQTARHDPEATTQFFARWARLGLITDCTSDSHSSPTPRN